MTQLTRAIQILTFLGIVLILVSIAASEACLGLAFLAWLPIVVHRTMTEKRLPWEWPPFFGAVRLFVLATILSVLFSVNPHQGMPAIRKLPLFFLCFLVVQFLDMKWTRRTLWALFSLGSLTGAYAAAQFIEKWWRFEKTGRPVDDPTLIFRVTGFMGHWMTFSGEQVLILAALLGCLSFLPMRRQWGSILATFFVSASVILSFTRSVWLASLVIFGLTLFWSVRKRALLVVPAVTLLLILTFPGAVHRRIDSFVDTGFSSNEGRIQMAKAGWMMFRSHPWFGVGPQRVDIEFRNILKAWGEYNPTFYTGHLHNNFIQLAAERGILALVAFTWLVLELLWRFFRGARRVSLSPERRALFLSGLLATVALVVAGFFEYNFGDSEVFILFLFLISAPYVAESEPL